MDFLKYTLQQYYSAARSLYGLQTLSFLNKVLLWSISVYFVKKQMRLYTFPVVGWVGVWPAVRMRYKDQQRPSLGFGLTWLSLAFAWQLDPLHVKSHHKKFHLKRLRNGIVMVRLDILQRCIKYCSAAGSSLDSRLYPIHLGSHHAKFQLNPLRNG